MQANKDKCESQEKAERESFMRSVVLTEWERTCSPPQSEEVCLLMLSLVLSIPVFGSYPYHSYLDNGIPVP